MSNKKVYSKNVDNLANDMDLIAIFAILFVVILGILVLSIIIT